MRDAISSPGYGFRDPTGRVVSPAGHSETPGFRMGSAASRGGGGGQEFARPGLGKGRFNARLDVWSGEFERPQQQGPPTADQAAFQELTGHILGGCAVGCVTGTVVSGPAGCLPGCYRGAASAVLKNTPHQKTDVGTNQELRVERLTKTKARLAPDYLDW